MAKKWEDMCTKSTVLPLALGQLLSLSTTFALYSSSKLATKGINAPCSQCFLAYVLLALVYGGIMLYRRQRPKTKLYHYIMLALFDVLAKYLAIEAVHYTSLTSVRLLNSWTTPCQLLLAWLFMKVKYGLQIFSQQKLVGVAICVTGIVTVIFSDLHSADGLSGINPLKGDLLIIIGATLYGVSNVYQEVFFKKADKLECLAFLGIFGVILTAPRIAIIERNEFKFIISSSETIFLFIGFSLAFFLLCSGLPLFVKIRGSRRIKLSLFTSNIWLALIRIFVYHEKVDWIYFVAFATFMLGLIVYSRYYKNYRAVEMDPNNGRKAV